LFYSFVDAPCWMGIYRKAFPTPISAVPDRNDGWAQRGGIDRVITLACGRVYTVDEKVRMNDWPDILLEQWSDEERRKPGGGRSRWRVTSSLMHSHPSVAAI
jgi:hypothetical protein